MSTINYPPFRTLRHRWQMLNGSLSWMQTMGIVCIGNVLGGNRIDRWIKVGFPVGNCIPYCVQRIPVSSQKQVIQIISRSFFEPDLCTGITMACFHSDSMVPSASDLFIRTVRGLARAFRPSLSRHAGIQVNSVDLDVLIFFSWSWTKVLSIVQTIWFRNASFQMSQE